MRVATFNVCHGSDGRGTPVVVDRLAPACARLGADVLALQEVDRGRRRSSGVDQAALVADALGLDHVFGPALQVAGDGEYGNALFTVGRLADVEVLALPGPRVRRRRPVEPRSVVLATVEAAGGTASVAATHLSTRPGVAVRQLWAAARALRRRPGPHVLLADANLGPRVVRAVVRPSGLRVVRDGGPSHPRRGPRVRIDQVAVAGLTVVGVAVVDLGISDHRAVVVELDARPAGSLRPEDGGRERSAARRRPEGRLATVGAVPFRPNAVRGAGTTGPGEIDYRLARQHLINEYKRGRLGRSEVCDAHPELVRAAGAVGEATDRPCPICEAPSLVLVSYVFGPRLPAHGRCITKRSELTSFVKRAGNYSCYVVEVCPACHWNHLARTFALNPVAPQTATR